LLNNQENQSFLLELSIVVNYVADLGHLFAILAYADYVSENWLKKANYLGLPRPVGKLL